MKKAFCMLLASAFIIANGLCTTIDPVMICKHIEILASDDFQGRKPGTIGEEKTLEYLSKQFESIGLEKPHNNSFLQEVTIQSCNIQAPRHISVEFENEDLEFEFKKDYLLNSQQDLKQQEIDAGLVFAGFGIHAPELGWDDYKHVDVSGKIVIVLADVPGEYTLDSLLWKGDPAANVYSKGFYKKNEAAKRGAVGLLTIYKQSKQAYFNWESLGAFIGVDDKQIKYPEDKDLLQFAGLLSQSSGRYLLENAGYSYEDLIQTSLDASFLPIDLKANMKFTFSNICDAFTSYNVAGLLKGSDLSDELLIYSAHWDHVGVNPLLADDSICNGAVDNASGTAALIELARTFKEEGNNRRSVLFLATTAEEMGLLGAIWYNHYPLFPMGKTVANFNMDSHYPYGKNSHITAVVYGRSELDAYLEAAAHKQNRTLISNEAQNIAMDIFFRSDHFPFAEAGVPSEFAVGFGEAVGHDNEAYQQKMSAYAYKYHQPSDEYEPSFDCSGIADDAELIYQAGMLIDREGAFPMWNEDVAFAKLRQKQRFESDYYIDVSKDKLPLASTQIRTMDAKPADLDGDGDIDLVLCGEYAGNVILLNNGDASFQDISSDALPLKTYDTEDVAVFDFDNDGDFDLYFASEDNRLDEFYLNNWDATFVDRSAFIPHLSKSNAVISLDLNKDGFMDLIIGNEGLNICLMNQEGQAWISDEKRLPFVAKTTQDLEPGDVDGDGDLDVICANEDGNQIWLNDGNGYFTISQFSNSIDSVIWESREIDLADVDHDGDLDLFMANVNFRQNKDASNRLFLNNGKGAFTDVTGRSFPSEIMHTTDADFLDLDRDGDLDIITGNVFGHTYHCYENDGTGIFTNATEKFIPASCRGEGIDIESADFNGDGKLDVYLGNFKGTDHLLLGK